MIDLVKYCNFQSINNNNKQYKYKSYVILLNEPNQYAYHFFITNNDDSVQNTSVERFKHIQRKVIYQIYRTQRDIQNEKSVLCNGKIKCSNINKINQKYHIPNLVHAIPN